MPIRDFLKASVKKTQKALLNIQNNPTLVIQHFKRYQFFIVTVVLLALAILWSDEGPVFVAFIVTYIGYLNWLAGQHKLRLELFEKRWQLYMQLQKLLGIISREANINYPELLNLMAGETHHKFRFLFDEDIQKYVDDIFKKCTELHYTHEIMKNPSASTEYENIVKSHHAVLNYLLEQSSKSVIKFKPYLYFGNL